MRNIAVLLVAAGWALSAQTPPTFRAVGRNVTVPLIVTDSVGHLVRDLSAADFELRDVLRDLELNNIAVYSMTMPRVGKDLLGGIRLSGAPQEGGGVVVSADLMKLVPEIYRGAKSGPKSGEDALSTMTVYLGGTRIPFRNLRQLEAGLASIREELHTGYVLSYTPDRADAGYHRIRVETPGRVLSVRARPGYYIASE
jgi:hypothetical protein